MNYLVILDYTTGTTVIELDPGYNDDTFDYNAYIKDNFGKMDYNYIVCNNLNIEI